MWIRFLAIRAEIFYGKSGDYYPSIGYEKSWFWALFAIFDFLGSAYAFKVTSLKV